MSYAIFFIVCDLFYFTSSNIMIVDIQSIITTCSKYEHDMIELNQTQSSRINQL